MPAAVPYGTLVQQRFWAKVDVRGPDECWPWTAAVTKETGYGIFHPRKPETRLAHRVAYESQHGPIPEGLFVDHTCHNGQGCPPGPCPHRKCCNPKHLEAVTNRENVNRSHNSNVQKTHCPRGHEYTPENTQLQIKSNTTSRKCKACGRIADNSPKRQDAQRARRARMKAGA